MEDTLGDVVLSHSQCQMNLCLNPCFNGRYSRRFKTGKFSSLSEVLILVLMEDTLGGIVR